MGCGKDEIKMENLTMQGGKREVLKQCSKVDKRRWIWPSLETLTVHVVTVIWVQTCVDGQICESSLLIVAVLIKRSKAIS